MLSAHAASSARQSLKREPSRASIDVYSVRIPHVAESRTISPTSSRSRGSESRAAVCPSAPSWRMPSMSWAMRRLAHRRGTKAFAVEAARGSTWAVMARTPSRPLPEMPMVKGASPRYWPRTTSVEPRKRSGRTAGSVSAMRPGAGARPSVAFIMMSAMTGPFSRSAMSPTLAVRSSPCVT
jgi:hypothetical protein